MADEADTRISQIIGHFGRWQIWLILPIWFHFVFISFQTLSISFMSRDTQNFFCQDFADTDIFESVQEWQDFSSPLVRKLLFFITVFYEQFDLFLRMALI